MPNDIRVIRKPLTWQQMTKMAMEEEARKQPPMSWEVPVDQMYAPSSDMAITTGSAPGGAGESMLQPADLVTMVPWGALAKTASMGAKEMVAAAPRLVGNEIGAIGKDIGYLKKSSESAFEKASRIANDYFKYNDYFQPGEYEQTIASKFVKGAESAPISRVKMVKELVDNPEKLSQMEELTKQLSKQYETTLLSNPRQRQLENIASWKDLIKLQAMHGAEPIKAQQIKMMLKK